MRVLKPKVMLVVHTPRPLQRHRTFITIYEIVLDHHGFTIQSAELFRLTLAIAEARTVLAEECCAIVRRNSDNMASNYLFRIDEVMPFSLSFMLFVGKEVLGGREEKDLSASQ